MTIPLRQRSVKRMTIRYDLLHKHKTYCLILNSHSVLVKGKICRGRYGIIHASSWKLFTELHESDLGPVDRSCRDISLVFCIYNSSWSSWSRVVAIIFLFRGISIHIPFKRNFNASCIFIGIFTFDLASWPSNHRMNGNWKVNFNAIGHSVQYGINVWRQGT